MSSSTEPSIPALIGGIPNHSDFAPSVLFAVLFGLTLVPFVRRLLNPDTRTWTFALGTLSYCVERMVVWGIRATQSHDHYPGEELSRGKLVYTQVSFALGFLGFAGDAVNFSRAVLVNATLEDPKRGSPDEPGQRFWARRFTDLYGLLYLAATVPGAVAYSNYSASTRDPHKADKVYNLRYASSGVALGLLLIFVACLLWAQKRLKYIDRKGVKVICGLCLFTCIIPIYRLSVMHYRTPDLNVIPADGGYPPNSLTTPASKATFYIFHALPELCVAWFIQSVNLRGLLNTGPFGDWRGSDNGAGIPRLRENGVEVDWVGVPTITTMKVPRWVSWMSRRFGTNHPRPEESRVELRNEPGATV